MSIVFRLLGHTGIFVSYVYIFCFASSLLESSWWNWPWFLLTGGFLLGCYAGIVPDDWNPDDVDYNDQLVAVSIIEPICLTSILIKLFVHASSYSGILLPLAVLYILAIGVNRVAFSQLFGLIGIFTVWPYANFHIWYELIGFIIFCILSVGLMVSSLIYHFNQEDDEDEDTLIGTSIANFVLVSLLLASGLLFINYRNPIVEQLPTMGYLYFVFCLLGLLVAFTNNVVAIISAIASSVFFFTFVLDWGTSVDWGLAGLSSTWQWLSLFFSTLWSWIVWCATHLWDGIVWCVVGLWKCIVWLATYIWDGIVWIASAIWWLLCWKWFWIGLATLACICIITAIIVNVVSDAAYTAARRGAKDAIEEYERKKRQEKPNKEWIKPTLKKIGLKKVIDWLIDNADKIPNPFG